MSQYELKSFSENGTMGEPKSQGFRIKAGTGFILVFLAIVAAVGVGLIVHFAENRTLECTYPDSQVTNGGGKTDQQQGQGPVAKQTTTKLPESLPPDTTPPLPQATAPTTEPPTPDIRLPRSFSPTHYNLKLKPNMYNGQPSTFTFDGSVEIFMKSLVMSNNVTLHMKSLNITEGSVRFRATSGAGDSPSFTSYSIDEDRDFLIIHLDGETTPGTEYSLSMRFVGSLKDDLRGLYYSSYKRGNQTVYLAVTQFEPTDTRRAFPCFDEPDIKATFKITVVRKSHLVSLSNMPVANQIPVADDFVEDVYKTSKRMSTYLVALVACDFKYTQMKVPNTDVMYRAWARPEMLEQTKFGVEVGARATGAYNTFFNISFPLPKQDMIALPDFGAGAMENWGLITYREIYMLYEDGVSSVSQQQSTALVITHELGHQWFGDLVTMDWWDDVWLNEGFATFMEYLATDMLYPEWEMFDRFVPAMHAVFETDSYVTSHPLSNVVETAADIHFDDIAYIKGGSLIRMVRFMLGDDTFKRGLRRYLKAHEYANTDHDDLWAALTQQSFEEKKALNITAIMKPWTLQMNYPVVIVVKDDGKLVVTQKRFLKNETAVDTGKYTSDFGYQWKIPFTFVTSSTPDFDVTSEKITWITQSRQEIGVPSLKATDWVIANIHQYGYYRVNYEDSNWQALIQQLKTNHKVIPTTNRAQIINDAWSLARAGQLSTTIALETLEYLDKESDLVPWIAARTQINFLDEILRQTEIYGKLQAFMVSQLKASFKRLGMSGANSTDQESLLRSLIVDLSCSFEMAECIQESQRLFDKWMSKPETNLIDPNVRDTVYCTAVAKGDATQWEFAFQQYQKATAATERTRLMKSMACTHSTWLINRYLKLSVTPTLIRKQDFATVIYYIADTPVGQLLAWDFIRENWDYLHNVYGKGTISFSGVISGITTSFSTKLHMEQLKSFLVEHPKFDTEYLQQTVEEIMSNIQWVTSNKDIVSDWLDSSASSQSTSRLTDVRLPRHLLPVLYDITLKPMMYSDDPETFTFEGHVKIYMNAKASGSNVTIHVNKLDILENSVRFESDSQASSPKYISGSMEADSARQFRIFHLDKTVEQGKNYSIEMNFTAKLTNDMAGLYYSEYKQGNDTIYLATTQFESTDARRAFPCFDEPELKAEFNVRLIRKSHLKSLSNMPITGTIKLDDDFMMDVYERSRKMSTYLLAFVVCDFKYTEGNTIRNTTYRAWSRPSSVNQTLVALDAGVKVIGHYEDYFDIAFPLPKQDMIAIPDFSAGAMENWGLITYRETAMLYQPGVSSASNKQRVQVVVAHELAHQWFGDLVTMEWWDDLWLNEGFASFVEYMGVDFISPSFHMFEQFIFDLHAVFTIDALVTSHPIFVPVKNPDEINEIFDTISYNKGGSVIRMIRFFLGEETFQKGLQIYLKRRKYSNADHDDLWAGLQTQANNENKQVNVRSIMDTWIKQMNYPVIKVTKADNGKIKITQNRFLSNADAEDPGKYISPFGYKWHVPFTYTTQKDPRFNQTDKDVKWLNSEEMELGDMYPTNEWVIGNIQQFGVYRVNYEENNWKLLVQQLRKDHSAIHVINRAQIINDAFGLAKANQLPMEIALSTLDYLDMEQDYVPWYAAGTELDYIETMLAETEAYGAFQRLLKKKVEKHYARLGLNDTDKDHLESFLRSSIADYACRSGSEACIKEAKSLFQQYKSNPDHNPINPNVKTTVYCTAVREGGEEEWQFIYDQYMQETVEAERSRLRYSLSCTRKVWILNKLLHMALDFSIIRKQDADGIFVYVAGDPVGRCVAWDFFRANFEQILQVYGSASFSMANIIEGITSSFSTDYRLQQLKDFQKLHPDMGTGTRAFSQAIEKTTANVNWMNKYYKTVEQWLAKSNSAM